MNEPTIETLARRLGRGLPAPLAIAHSGGRWHACCKDSKQHDWCRSELQGLSHRSWRLEHASNATVHSPIWGSGEVMALACAEEAVACVEGMEGTAHR
jgi:hypothetical protein